MATYRHEAPRGVAAAPVGRLDPGGARLAELACAGRRALGVVLAETSRACAPDGTSSSVPRLLGHARPIDSRSPPGPARAPGIGEARGGPVEGAGGGGGVVERLWRASSP